ncbi:unnamed protein product, partial [marine sediment metagenome]
IGGGSELVGKFGPLWELGITNRAFFANLKNYK